MTTTREMTPDDWADVARIYQAGIEIGIATFQTTLPTWTEWDESHLDICRLVAVNEGKIVGWAALMSYSPMKAYAGVAEISVYVDPESHGLGIGTLLVETMSEASEREGIWSLQSKIIKGNDISIRLHEKCGYRFVGEHKRIAQDRNGVWKDTVLMERRSEKL